MIVTCKLQVSPDHRNCKTKLFSNTKVWLWSKKYLQEKQFIRFRYQICVCRHGTCWYAKYSYGLSWQPALVDKKAFFDNLNKKQFHLEVRNNLNEEVGLLSQLEEMGCYCSGYWHVMVLESKVEVKACRTENELERNNNILQYRYFDSPVTAP